MSIKRTKRVEVIQRACTQVIRNLCTSSSVCVEVVRVVGRGGGGAVVLVCVPTSGGTVQYAVRRMGQDQQQHDCTTTNNY